MIANPNDGNSPRVEVATPTISVSSGGLITAKTEQEKGYVPGGTKSATQQLTTQGAATITPGTTNQTAVASGRYTTGAVTVKGDANLKAENIAEGVSIFGVQGTHSGGGESATVTIINKYDFYGTYKYTNAYGEFVEQRIGEYTTGTPLNVLKNTIIYCSKDTNFSFIEKGSISEIDNYLHWAFFLITGNGSIEHTYGLGPV